MLPEATLDLVKASIPVLEDHGETITRSFYDILLNRHPELRHIFNAANQHKATQARALADAVFAYASNIETPENLTAAVNRIAHKHASLLVRPEHYPLVGGALLEALAGHLGVGMDDPIIQAWADAYGVLAKIFIDREAKIYAAAESNPGGWRDLRAFKVERVVRESTSVKSFYLVPSDGGSVPAYAPGQYIGVHVDIPGQEYRQIRQYSLSDAPGNDHLRISVKAETGALPGTVSNFLHDTLTEGDTLMLSPPHGDFTLNQANEREHLVLISGGVGLTPLVSMLRHELGGATASRPVTFIHAARDAQEHAMKTEIASLAEEHGFRSFVSYDEGAGGDHEGPLDARALEKFLPEGEKAVYLCGPFGFMAAVYKLLYDAGVPASRIHYEVFGPTLSLAA